MVAKENAAPNTSSPDVMHVPRKAFEVLRAKLSKGADIGKDEVSEMVNPTTIKNTEIYIPIDMNGANENLDDFEAALAKLGPLKCAQSFVRAFEHFEKTKHKICEEERPQEINGTEYKELYDMEDDDDDEDKPMYFPDTFYVPRKAFEAIRAKVNKGEIVSKEEVDGLVNWEPSDKEMYEPIDMKGADEDLDEFEEALEALGPQKTAQCFIQAFETFQKNKHLLPTRKQKALTGKQWKDDNHEDGEEEENHDEDEEEEEDDSGDEPEAKKAKKA